VADSAGFRALLAMSAYHHVAPGTRYPAVLLVTGYNDSRVRSWHPGKLAAALQHAATPHPATAHVTGRPVLLRVNFAGGHGSVGGSAEEQRASLADQFAFFAAALGLSVR
jgi:prolyl oligopeptidase